MVWSASQTNKQTVKFVRYDTCQRQRQYFSSKHPNNQKQYYFFFFFSSYQICNDRSSNNGSTSRIVALSCLVVIFTFSSIFFLSFRLLRSFISLFFWLYNTSTNVKIDFIFKCFFSSFFDPIFIFIFYSNLNRRK